MDIRLDVGQNFLDGNDLLRLRASKHRALLLEGLAEFLGIFGNVRIHYEEVHSTQILLELDTEQGVAGAFVVHVESTELLRLHIDVLDFGGRSPARLELRPHGFSRVGACFEVWLSEWVQFLPAPDAAVRD